MNPCFSFARKSRAVNNLTAHVHHLAKFQTAAKNLCDRAQACPAKLANPSAVSARHTTSRITIGRGSS